MSLYDRGNPQHLEYASRARQAMPGRGYDATVADRHMDVLRELGATYGEASYYHGCQFQHIVAWQEHSRLARIDRENRRAYRRGMGR